MGTAFGGNALSLGALLAGAAAITTLALGGESVWQLTGVCAGVLCLGMLVEAIGHVAHGRDMGAAEHEGGAAHYVQTTTFGKTYLLRNTLLGLNLALVSALLVGTLVSQSAGWLTLAGLALVGVLLLCTSVMGRALFYVLVIPTTMPGAFFWKNKGFEQHARDIGLAHMPQVGVPPLRH